MKTRTTILILIVLNVIVLVGQLWPEGAPPFARIVNIVFLVGSLLFFAGSLRRDRQRVGTSTPDSVSRSPTA